MSKPIYIIYKHTCIISHKSYIGLSGQSIKKRWNSHICSSKNNSQLHFHNAIRKYGSNNFIHEILFTTHNQNIISEAEIFLIDYFDTFNTGYNMTIGGEGGHLGQQLSEETKKKLSISLSGEKNPMYGKQPWLGKKHKKNSKLKMSIAKIGKRRTSESIQKQIQTITGRKHSKETKLKIGRKGVKNFQFKGYFHSPFGKLESTDDIKHYSNITPGCFRRWCYNSNKIISWQSEHQSSFLTKEMIGKTFKEIGFWFEKVI